VPDGISGPAPVAIEDVVARIIALGAACEPAFRTRLAAVLEEDEYSGDSVACLVADAHLLPVFQVAARMGVPALALRTGSAASYACFAAYPMLCDRGYLPVQGTSRSPVHMLHFSLASSYMTPLDAFIHSFPVLLDQQAKIARVLFVDSTQIRSSTCRCRSCRRTGCGT
jgi:hypothetical protein